MREGGVVDQKIVAADGAKLIRSAEDFLQAAYTLYDVAKVIPHPYNAIGGFGNSFLHDFKSFAFSLNKYVRAVDAALDEKEAEE